MGNHLQRIIGHELIPAIAYGDAAGLPFEAMEKPLRPGTVKGLQDTETNPYIGQYPAGTWSDDTHLSVAVAEGLIEGNGFNLEAMAYTHVESLKYVNGQTDNHRWATPLLSLNGKTGWGRGTTGSVERLGQGVHPLSSGNLETSGNGVLMKLAPLVFWQSQQEYLPSSDREQQIIDFTRMTHASPEAISTSLIHAELLINLLHPLSHSAHEPAELYLATLADAKDIDHEFDRSYKTSTVLAQLAPPIHSGTLRRSNVLDAAVSKGFHAPDTLVMAYGSFILESTSPDSVYRAVEMGGDADSIGSIVNTMSLFLSGSNEKPHDYRKIHDATRLETVSKQLTNLALSGRV